MTDKRKRKGKREERRLKKSLRGVSPEADDEAICPN